MMKILSIAVIIGYASAMSQTAADFNRKYYGGAGVGRLNLDKGVKLEQWECKYDILLVERIQGKPKTETGLFVPEEELPKFHIAEVLSMGSGKYWRKKVCLISSLCLNIYFTNSFHGV